MRTSSLILGPLDRWTGSPDRELAAVVGGTEPLATVIAFPKQPAVPQATPSRPATGGRPFQLKVTLRETKPPIWRRILVDGSDTLDRVHEVIQAAFGWWGYHLHEFEVGRARYGVPDPDDDWGEPTRDERRTLLDAIADEGTSFRYMYDFGDGWDHRVVVEKIHRRLPARLCRRSASLPARGLQRSRGLPGAAGDPRRPRPSRTPRADRVAGASARP